MTAFSRLALSRYLTLYAALYAGFGVLSPYLPSLLESRDLRPEAIALVLAAQAVGYLGIASVVGLNAAPLAPAAFAALLVPQLPPTKDAARATEAKGGVRGVGALLRLPLYRRVVLVAALIMGSHAMHD